MKVAKPQDKLKPEYASIVTMTMTYISDETHDTQLVTSG